MTDISRRPAGTPAGGQFAPGSTPEASSVLDGLDLHDSPAAGLAGAATVIADTFGPGAADEFLERESRRCPTCDSAGFVPDPTYRGDFRSTAREVPCGTCRGAGWLPSKQEWAEAGVTDAELRDHLNDHGVRPNDFTDADRNVRMWACSVRGDMIFEGELLSTATQLYRHVPGIDETRHFHSENEVTVAGQTVSWHSMPADQKVMYISGYARAVSGGDLPALHEGQVVAAGYRRGQIVNRLAAELDTGFDTDRKYWIVEPDSVDRRLAVGGVRPDPERGGYSARVVGGQWRTHHSDDGSRVVPWHAGQSIFFTVDALGAGEGVELPDGW